MMSVAQEQQHSSGKQHSRGGDVGRPEEAPLVAPATLPFLVCVTKSHGAASTPWSCGCTYVQRMVDRSVIENFNMHVAHFYLKHQL